jgi:hypothetical protein
LFEDTLHEVDAVVFGNRLRGSRGLATEHSTSSGRNTPTPDYHSASDSSTLERASMPDELLELDGMSAVTHTAASNEDTSVPRRGAKLEAYLELTQRKYLDPNDSRFTEKALERLRKLRSIMAKHPF